ncbi:MAG: hypothetical protein LBI05_01995 [Planctomycetaceae bacterium]|jgi:capsular polysaccharide export protein|nr:hypothetical protein [Planctomycetaceae bacterium]
MELCIRATTVEKITGLTGLTGLTRNWQEVQGLFWQSFYYVANIMGGQGFRTRLNALLDRNPGLDVLDKASSPPLIAQIWALHRKFKHVHLPRAFEKVECQSFWSGSRADMYFLWGAHHTLHACGMLRAASKNHKPLFLIEDGFFKSADTPKNRRVDIKYLEGISFVVDDKAMYFDATRKSRLEAMLNDNTLIINEQQKQRAKQCMEMITSTYLTKYNHQPIFTPQIGRQKVPKVLVVDQSYGDMSISLGLANDATFQNMLDSAIAENPDADIIIKTHPDSLATPKKRPAYYTGVEQQQNLYKITYPINPIALLKSVDKVYVCTSQLGFESLMCGKETHVFGMPFYAGWGLTNDRLVCPRRTNPRTLEEVFYIAYIMYSRYANPVTKSRCEIEEAMNYLLTLRAEYFEKFSVRCELDERLEKPVSSF